MPRYIIERITRDRFAVLHDHGRIEVTADESQASRFSEKDLAEFWLDASQLSRLVWTVRLVRDDVAASMA